MADGDMNKMDKPRMEDPWSTLGIPEDADGDAIRSAYLKKVKQYPPDRCGDQFEKIRDAYSQLKDPYRRGRWLILGSSDDLSLVSVVDAIHGKRRFVGPKPWLSVIKRAMKKR
jgi:DnaJ-domain-containing protein 1